MEISNINFDKDALSQLRRHNINLQRFGWMGVVHQGTLHDGNCNRLPDAGSNQVIDMDQVDTLCPQCVSQGEGFQHSSSSGRTLSTSVGFLLMLEDQMIDVFGVETLSDAVSALERVNASQRLTEKGFNTVGDPDLTTLVRAVEACQAEALASLERWAKNNTADIASLLDIETGDGQKFFMVTESAHGRPLTSLATMACRISDQLLLVNRGFFDYFMVMGVGRASAVRTEEDTEEVVEALKTLYQEDLELALELARNIT